MIKPGDKNKHWLTCTNRISPKEIEVKCALCNTLKILPSKKFSETKSCGCASKGSSKVPDSIINQELATNTKRCSECLEFKPHSEFYKNTGTSSKTRYGVSSKCQSCFKKQHQNLGRTKAKQLYLGAKNRSTNVTITEDWILDKLSSGKCEVTGMAFEFETKAKTRYPMAPSLDQINPGKGYTPENTRLVCNWFNTAKSEYSDEQLFSWFQEWSNYRN